MQVLTSAYEKEWTHRAKRVKPCKKRETPASITVQLPRTKKHMADAAAPAGPTSAAKLELLSEGRARKALGVFMTEPQIRVLWSKLHHIKDNPWNSFSTMHCHLSDKDCVLPHIILLVANLPWNFILNAKWWLFSGVWVIPFHISCLLFLPLLAC